MARVVKIPKIDDASAANPAVRAHIPFYASKISKPSQIGRQKNLKVTPNGALVLGNVLPVFRQIIGDKLVSEALDVERAHAMGMAGAMRDAMDRRRLLRALRQGAGIVWDTRYFVRSVSINFNRLVRRPLARCQKRLAPRTGYTDMVLRKCQKICVPRR